MRRVIHPSSQKANPQNLPITPRQVLFLKCGLSVLDPSRLEHLMRGRAELAASEKALFRLILGAML